MRKIILLISIVLSLFATSVSDFIDKSKCDQIINKKVFKVCYSYRYKAALAVWYELNGYEQRLPKIKKRPRFYNEKTIPMRYRAKYRDYTHSGYDRGHLANNWDFAYSKKAQYKTFSLCNIVAQSPITNRIQWEKAERYERLIALKLGRDRVINLVKYSNNPQRIGRDRIAVPYGFYKIIYNDNQKFMKCFYYKNISDINANKDKLRNHLVDCDSVKN